MYAIIAGAGKVGWNLARELIEKGNEVTLLESDRNRYLVVEQELEHAIQYGDATELWVLERAGIVRADLVIAVTGDDEDNILICQMAKEKYLCERDHRPGEQPAEPPALRAAGDPAGGVGDGPDPAADRARGAALRPGAPARPARGPARDHRGRGGRRRSPAAGSRVADIELPEGSLDHLGAPRGRGLRAHVGHGDRGGDEVLLVLDPGLEEAITAQFVRQREAAGCLTAASTSCSSEAGWRPPTARAGCARRAPTASCCWWAASPTRPTTARPAPRGTCRARRRARTSYFRPDEWWDEQRIELLTRTSVTKLDPVARVATLSTREEVAFDKALLATGANVRRLQVDGVRARGDPLPAHAGATPTRSGRTPRRAERVVVDRRLLHRHRGGGLADAARQARARS